MKSINCSLLCAIAFAIAVHSANGQYWWDETTTANYDTTPEGTTAQWMQETTAQGTTMAPQWQTTTSYDDWWNQITTQSANQYETTPAPTAADCVCPCHCECHYNCVPQYGIRNYYDECGCFCTPNDYNYYYYDASTASPPMTTEETIQHPCPDLKLVTTNVTIMGHQPIVFESHCFDDCAVTNVTCTFYTGKNMVHVVGRTERSLFEKSRAICYAPYFYATGDANVTLSVTTGDGRSVEKNFTLPIDASKPEVVGSDGSGSSITLRVGDLSATALTKNVLSVDIVMVWYNPVTKLFEDLLVVQSDRQLYSSMTVSLPKLSTISHVNQAALASTYVTFAIRPRRLDNGLEHPFHPGAAIFTMFYPAMHLDQTLRNSYKAGVCKAWYSYTPKIKPPRDCPSTLSGASANGYHIYQNDLKYSNFLALPGVYSGPAYWLTQAVQPSQLGLGQKCFYYPNQNLIDGWPYGGTANLYSPHKDEREHFREDEVAWYACCYNSESSDNCKLYFDARKSNR